MADEGKSEIIVLENVRLAFPNFDKARAFEDGGTPRFEGTFLLDEKNQQTKAYKKLKKAAQEAAETKWGADNLPRKLRMPFLTVDDMDKIPDGYEDEHVILRARTTIKPGLVDRANQPVLNPTEVFYPGCRVNAAVHAYAWSNPKGGKGVSISLDHLQFWAEDEPFGKRTKPQDVFAAADDADDDDDDDDEPV